MFGGLLSMAGYFSVVGVHTTLWVFVAFYLPRTTFLANMAKLESGESQVSSRDRPQHHFLAPLTANPASTLLYICVGGIILQSWWAEWMRDWWLQLGLKGTEEEKRTEKAFHDRQKMTTSRNAWIATFAASLAIHAILVLFGAPLASFAGRTYLLALLISIMTVYSPAYTIGVPDWGSNSTSAIRRWTWVRLFAEYAPRNGVERALLFPAIGTVVGCWIGVIPIALDWDRPWQAWPLTPAFGAIAGYITSSTVALSVNGVVHMAQEYSRAQHDATEQKSK
ncbi:hypothetical protein HYPSUDRAFT_140786 [Hypholoma sublateritium FD-334 SS-4]|uniref:Uncharacterized protein n=1 Tax=Hypholoma sublateritium (strain FD-334 SS-4) TaxID=945553 RepID=A0A0D2L3H0_HYPSF|nr:hypothetical protein HYPSUDRAFT_140786 [Hypholoma sublateritium FD-334 SS-4]